MAEQTVRVGSLEGSTLASNMTVQKEDLVYSYHQGVWWKCLRKVENEEDVERSILSAICRCDNHDGSSAALTQPVNYW